MSERKVGHISEILEDRPFLVETEGFAIGIVRVKDRLYGFENRCCHQGGPVCLGDIYGRMEPVLGPNNELLGERMNNEARRLVCPWHGWEYDLETGECVTDRNLKLKKIPVHRRGDEVYIEWEESP